MMISFDHGFYLDWQTRADWLKSIIADVNTAHDDGTVQFGLFDDASTWPNFPSSDARDEGEDRHPC